MPREENVLLRPGQTIEDWWAENGLNSEESRASRAIDYAQQRREQMEVYERNTSMRTLMSDVTAFHIACDFPVSLTPAVPPPERVALRMELIREEVNAELLPSMEQNNLVAIADGMADAIYVIVGAALEYGIPLHRVWQAVQAANMKKVDPTTGKVRYREDGKVLKPDGWMPPDIASVLEG